MSEEKKNKIAAAFTVNAVLLLVIIVAVLIYQMVQITSLSTQKQQIEQQIVQLEGEIEESKDMLEYYKLEQTIIELAYKNKYIK